MRIARFNFFFGVTAYSLRWAKGVNDFQLSILVVLCDYLSVNLKQTFREPQKADKKLKIRTYKTLTQRSSRAVLANLTEMHFVARFLTAKFHDTLRLAILKNYFRNFRGEKSLKKSFTA